MHRSTNPSTLSALCALAVLALPAAAGALEARVVHLNPAGSVARVHLLAPECAAAIHAEVSLERYAELALRVGETVYVSPRRVRVFVPEYSI